jgi:hypothetical protein
VLLVANGPVIRPGVGQPRPAGCLIGVVRLGEAVEAEDRMELDRVRRHARLPVEVVPEGDPTTRAREQRRTFCLACRICRLRSAVAFGVHIGAFGASAIMCFVPRSSTRCKSWSASSRTSVTAATTLKMWRSNGSRVDGTFAGLARLTR